MIAIWLLIVTNLDMIVANSDYLCPTAFLLGYPLGLSNDPISMKSLLRT